MNTFVLLCSLSDDTPIIPGRYFRNSPKSPKTYPNYGNAYPNYRYEIPHLGHTGNRLYFCGGKRYFPASQRQESTPQKDNLPQNNSQANERHSFDYEKNPRHTILPIGRQRSSDIRPLPIPHHRSHSRPLPRRAARLFGLHSRGGRYGRTQPYGHPSSL